ncbi:uncharacterized protein [Rutidosis leptorrhynchoides]|uniref:uncharacterized protein n=1 Tax=Rutidosis leptorrhynchoides TaxID=125765 RepID=UPI003A9A0FCD
MMYSSHEFTSSDSFSSQATVEKSKGSNLIAKLMGLDEFPSKSLPSSPRKQSDITSKIRPVFDFDLPNAKKPQFFIQKVNREHTSLDGIIEMMQYKGLLGSKKRENKRTGKSYMDDSPPIVLMRPHRLGSDIQNVKVYDNPIRKLHREKAKAEEDISVKNRGKLKLPSDNQKTFVHVVTKPQRKQEMEKKVDKVQKIAPRVKGKPVVNTKTATVVSKNDFLKQVKPSQRSVLPDPVTKRISSSVSSSNKSNNCRKNPSIEKPTIIQEVLQINSLNQNETQDSGVKLEEIDNLRQHSLCEAFEEDSDSANDAVTCTNHPETINNRIETCKETDVIYVNERKARILQSVSNFQDSELLYQDYVDEFLEHEKQRQNPLGFMLRSTVCNSENHAMREIAKAIESLKSYSMYTKETSNADKVSEILERDIFLSTIGGAWSSGWKDGCTVNEVEEVVLDMEKMVLSKLIDGMLMELVSSADLCKRQGMHLRV